MNIATPSVLASPESRTSCVTSTDPTGFIYGSYRAAATGAHRDKSSPKSSRGGVAHLSSSVGDSVSILSFENSLIRNRVGTRTSRGGGTRDKVRGFSGASRRNLLRRL